MVFFFFLSQIQNLKHPVVPVEKSAIFFLNVIFWFKKIMLIFPLLWLRAYKFRIYGEKIVR